MASERADSPRLTIAALSEYATKRAFGATPEPAPEPVAARSGPLLFVVQQHAARQLHFDLRLELDGVLKSWAVPKGLLIQPGEKHLAVPTEDHPLTYGPFEGVIPKGQYGAGSVIVWDCGPYSPDTDARYALTDRAQAEERVRAELAAGKLSFFLLGAKLKGSYALVRMKDQTWLVLKHRDPWGARVTESAAIDRSVLSTHTVADIALAHGITTNAVPKNAAERLPLERLIPHGADELLPEKIAPMLAGSASAPFSDPAWSFEPKLDGYRILAHVASDRVQLRSRGGIDLTAAFPAIVDDLKRQVAAPMLLDGEVVAFQDGRPSFGALQNRARLKAPVDIDAAERSTPCVFFCFDLLHVLGKSLRAAPHDDRRRYLSQCLLTTQRVQLVHADTDGNALYRAAIAAGFEGMMAKRRAGIYRAGRRSDDWLKVKSVQSGEFVIGGYTEGKGARGKQFGALVLGVWNGEKLRPVGNVGSGFDDRALASLLEQLRARKTTSMPFDAKPEAESRMHWVKPELVAEIQFAGWTDAGLLRAAIFMRLRDDVDPRTITSERKQSIATTGADASAASTNATIDRVLQQLAGSAQSLTLAVNDHRIRLTHLDKALWPAHEDRAPITKRDLLRYLAQASPMALAHWSMRPLTVVRMPDGIHGEAFFQKHWDGTSLPAFVSTVSFDTDDGPSKPYLLCNNIETLLWLGQMGALEYHVIHASVPGAAANGGARSHQMLEREVIDRPDYITFDLDPYIYAGTEGKGEEPVFNSAAFEKAREVAFHLRDLLAAMSLRAFVKTTGKTGLHIFVPIERTITADQAREFSRLVGQHLLRQHPQAITMDWAIEKRTGKIFLDHNMNGRGRTLGAAYSPRRVPGGWVSMPLSWDALATADPSDFRVSTLAQRLRDNGDAWRDFDAARHNLTRLLDLPG